MARVVARREEVVIGPSSHNFSMGPFERASASLEASMLSALPAAALEASTPSQSSTAADPPSFMVIMKPISSYDRWPMPRTLPRVPVAGVEQRVRVRGVQASTPVEAWEVVR